MSEQSNSTEQGNTKYKIEVCEYGFDYSVKLLKKGWLFWNLIESRIVNRKSAKIFTQNAIELIIEEWQTKYNVPDSMIFIQD